MGTRDKMAVMGEAEGSDYVLSMLYGSLRELVHMLFQKWEFLFFWRDNTYKRMEFSQAKTLFYMIFPFVNKNNVLNTNAIRKTHF